MTERKHIENALRACADAGVPEIVDPWPEIRARALVGRRRSPRQSRFVPRTRVGWVFAAVLVMLFSTGAYAVSEVAYEAFTYELPGATGDDIGVPVNMRQVDYGAAVTVERVYADAGYVVVSYSIEDLREDRRIAGHPVDLMPMDVIDEFGYEESTDKEFPERVRLTGEGDGRFALVDGGGQGPLAHTAVFATPEEIDTGRKHRFRLEIPVEAYPLVSRGQKELSAELIGDPFVFEFEVDVPPVPVVEVGQTVKKYDVQITLERVVDSPRPHAVFCFQPPDQDYSWGLTAKKTGLAWSEPADGYFETRRVSRDCWIASLSNEASSYSSLTVTEISGFHYPADGETWDGTEDSKTITGPWTFEFEVPEQ
jgi:hypothetical protein